MLEWSQSLDENMLIYYTKHGRFETDDIFKVPVYHLHRLDGPAFFWGNDTTSYDYCIDGNTLNREAVDAWLTTNNIDLSKKINQMLFKLKFAK